MSQTFYDLSAMNNAGKTVSMKDFADKAVIVVNTASKCGFTPQYTGLQKLHETYADKGLVILGFPCDQFAHQEPGTDAEIAEFCSVNFGVTFPLMAKVEVNGKNTHPVFEWLKDQAPGAIGKTVKWNFTKFLVSPDGKKVERFAPDFPPEKMESAIQKALGL